MTPEEQLAKNYDDDDIFWDNPYDLILHACRGAQMVPGDRDTYLVWTLCGRDVPVNVGYRVAGRDGSTVRADEVTCVKCKGVLENEDLSVQD